MGIFADLFSTADGALPDTGLADDICSISMSLAML